MGPFHHFEGLFLLKLTFLLVSVLQPIKGQAEMDLVDSTDNVSSTSTLQPLSDIGPETELTRSPTVLRICVNDDPLSNAHCKCDNNVISCDFSNYSPTHDNRTVSGNAPNNNSSLPSTDIELDLNGYQFPPNASRFCICNTPPTMNLTFSKENFLPFRTNNIHRFDLYNLRGVTKLMGGFGKNFQGDLFIANVSYIPDIEGFEFGSLDGDGSENIENLQDLKCCSPIKVSQQQSRPLLLIENTTIGRIHTRGLNDVHLWKTFILKSVRVQGVQKMGIIFDSYAGYNVSIIGSKFENVQRFGLIFKDPLNLLMVKNYFKRSTSHTSWWSRSNLNDSNILLMNNIFWNGMSLNMDAQKVVSWLNIYDVWDNYTFSQMHYTSFFPKPEGGTGSQRSISFKYNLINQGFDLDNSLDFGGSKAILSKNVIGTCNCSLFGWRDEFIKPKDNYCFTGSIAEDRDVTGKCSIFLEKAIKECSKKKESRADFIHFCKDKKASTPGFPGMETNLSEDIVDARINSSFISLIIQDFQSYFGLKKIQIGKVVCGKGGAEMDTNPHGHSQDDEHSGADGNGGESKSNSLSKTDHGTRLAWSIFVTILVIGCVIVLSFVVVKYKHRFVWRRGGHQRLLGSQETLI